MLTSILDSSLRRTPPPIHTPGRETRQHLKSAAKDEERRKYIMYEMLLYCTSHTRHSIQWWQGHRSSHSTPFNEQDGIAITPESLALLVAFICTVLNVIRVFTAWISSFTLSCPWRTNQKSGWYFTWSPEYRKHPSQSKFTARAHSRELTIHSRLTDKPINRGLVYSFALRQAGTGAHMANDIQPQNKCPH